MLKKHAQITKIWWLIDSPTKTTYFWIWWYQNKSILKWQFQTPFLQIQWALHRTHLCPFLPNLVENEQMQCCSLALFHLHWGTQVASRVFLGVFFYQGGRVRKYFKLLILLLRLLMFRLPIIRFSLRGNLKLCNI